MRAAGFTLVETLVAFAVLAVLLGALFPALTGPLRQSASNDAALRATLWAESVLDSVGHAIPLRDGESSGEAAGGIRWTARMARLGNAAPPAYQVTVGVTVSDGARTAQASLTSVRLGGAQP